MYHLTKEHNLKGLSAVVQGGENPMEGEWPDARKTGGGVYF